jgi:inner membrane protein
LASPLGHALTGFAIGRLATSGGGRDSSRLVAACVALAIAPDLDFVPGLLLAGRPSLYHQGASHSLSVALAASLAVAWLLARGRTDLPRVWLALFAAWASHLALDWLGTDSRLPIGIPLFWPFSDATWISPVAILPGIRHALPGRESSAQWLEDVLGLENLRALGVEVLFVAPLVLLAEWTRRRRRDR